MTHGQAYGPDPVVLLIGTQKGLFMARREPEEAGWVVTGPFISGYEIPHAWIDNRAPERACAAVYHNVWGTHVYTSGDGGRAWSSLEAAPSHPPGLYPSSLRAIWYLAPGSRRQPATLFAGIDPPGLFVSHDGGASWEPLPGLNEHPSRDTWEPARGGFAVHSIHVEPEAGHLMYAAVSAGGAYRSEDGGLTWTPINRGVRAENLPGTPETGHNIHRLVMHPREPRRLYRQCYNGTYRSDDGGDTWQEITEGLPSDFGYAIAVDAHDPDLVFQVPIESSHMRTAAGGRLRVYRSRDGGRAWEPTGAGLPQRHVYVTVLREALDLDDRDPCGVYFGTSSGHVFASPDAGENWEMVAAFLPRVLCVDATVVRSGTGAARNA